MLFQLAEHALRRHSFSAVPDGGRALGEVMCESGLGLGSALPNNRAFWHGWFGIF